MELKKENFYFKVKCHIDCGIHGKCSINNKDQCQCNDGWTGENCQKKICSKLCKQCDDNGACLCENGFTGRYCQIGWLI
jgi:hypothetical protein